MSVFKIRLVTGSNYDTFYKRINVPRESYVDITETNRVVLKHGDNKWRKYNSVLDKEYIENKKELISGLVFKTRQDAKIFMEKRKNTLEKLAKQNPTFKRYEIFGIMSRFMPDNSKLKFWSEKNSF